MSNQSYTDIYTRFNIVKIALISLSIVLIVFTLIAMIIGWNKWRSYQRNRNYPFVSNVIYNPINTVSCRRRGGVIVYATIFFSSLKWGRCERAGCVISSGALSGAHTYSLFGH